MLLNNSIWFHLTAPPVLSYSCLAIPFQSLAVKLDIVFMDLQRLVKITVNELTNIRLSKKRGQSRNDNGNWESRGWIWAYSNGLINFLLRCPRWYRCWKNNVIQFCPHRTQPWPILKSSVPIRMPEEVIPARVTTLMYTNEQEKLEYTHRIRKIGLPSRHVDSMYSSVQRLLHWQSKVPVGW